MEIKVYDENNKLVKIIPMYQAGGMVLPQYTPVESNLYNPQQSAETSINMSQRNLEFENQRQQQNLALDLQRANQSMQAFQGSLDNLYRQEQLDINRQQLELNKKAEERLATFAKLQNEKFKQDILKENNANLNEILKQDDAILPRDRAQMDLILKENGWDDESLLSMDLSDTEALYRKQNARKAFLAQQKNAMDNIKKHEEVQKILAKREEIDKRAKMLSESKYLDEDQYYAIMQADNNLSKKSQDWANGIISDFDITTDPDFALLNQYDTLIDEKEQKLVFDQAKQADALELQDTALKIKQVEQQIEFDEQFGPTERAVGIISKIAPNMKIVSGINSVLPADKQIDFTNPQSIRESLNKLTPEEWSLVSDQLTATTGKQMSLQEAFTNATISGDEETAARILQANKLWSASDNNNSTVNYVTDTAGNTIGIADNNGNVNYGAFTENKNGEPLNVTFNGQPFPVIVSGTGGDKEYKVQGLDKTTVQIVTNQDGTKQAFLKIKGDNDQVVDWLEKQYPTWDELGFQEIENFPEFEGAPQGTRWNDAEHTLYLPVPNTALPTQTSTSGSGAYGSQSSGYFPQQGSGTNQAPNTVPANAKDVL